MYISFFNKPLIRKRKRCVCVFTISRVDKRPMSHPRGNGYSTGKVTGKCNEGCNDFLYGRKRYVTPVVTTWRTAMWLRGSSFRVSLLVSRPIYIFNDLIGRGGGGARAQSLGAELGLMPKGAEPWNGKFHDVIK